MDKKYIKKIILESTKNSNVKKELFFEKGVNVIIGPKGGGKSSLLNIIHSFHNSVSLSNSLKAMTREFGFKINCIEYSNGESIYFKNLDSKSKIFNDLIKQEDQIKTKLDENKEIVLAKQNFIKKLTTDKIVVIALLFSQYFSTFLKIKDIRNSKIINWSSFLKSLDKSNNKIYDFILNLNKNLDFKFKTNLKNDLEMMALLERYIELLSHNHNDFFLINKSWFEQIIRFHRMNTKFLVVNNTIQKSFDETMEHFSNKANESSDISHSATLWKENINSLFVDLAKELAKNSCYHKKLQSGAIMFLINGKEDTEFGMTLNIDKTIQLEQGDNDDEDSWHKAIFDRFLYSPNEKRSSWINWVKKSNSSQSPLKISDDIFSSRNDEEENLTEIKKIVEDILFKKVEKYVQLQADGKDYLTMSLGTRTSYGLKQKIKNFNSPILFLDQPEDNLDNYTIYSELLKLFDFSRKNNNIEQIFLVTHNSNLGSLTNPSTITTCTIERDNLNNSYIQNSNIKEAIKISENITDSPILHYLEGGEESLINRENALLKNKNDFEHKKNSYSYRNNNFKNSFNKKNDIKTNDQNSINQNDKSIYQNDKIDELNVFDLLNDSYSWDKEKKAIIKTIDKNKKDGDN